MADEELPVFQSIRDLVELLDSRRPLFVRISKGPSADGHECSRDYESGLNLPGLAVNPLDPEPWWSRPAVEWIARRLCNYAHLKEEAPDERRPWVLSGRVVARGPDNEPLVADIEPIGYVGDEVLAEAGRIYEARFQVGKSST
jgi:hypothetical protein